MAKNLGTGDRIIRALLALVVLVLYVLKVISGVSAVILGIFAGILLVTSFMGYCSVYVPLGISTRKKETCDPEHG